MRLTVELAPDQPEGPLWIEVGAPRPLGLGTEPVAGLGARFVQVEDQASDPVSA